MPAWFIWLLCEHILEDTKEGTVDGSIKGLLTVRVPGRRAKINSDTRRPSSKRRDKDSGKTSKQRFSTEMRQLKKAN